MFTFSPNVVSLASIRGTFCIYRYYSDFWIANLLIAQPATCEEQSPTQALAYLPAHPTLPPGMVLVFEAKQGEFSSEHRARESSALAWLEAPTAKKKSSLGQMCWWCKASLAIGASANLRPVGFGPWFMFGNNIFKNKHWRGNSQVLFPPGHSIY